MRRLAVAILVALTLAAPLPAQTVEAVRIGMTEFAFHPSHVHLPHGRRVRLLLVNRGRIAHQFDAAFLRRVPATVTAGTLHVEATGLEFVRLDPGGTASVAFVPLRTGRFAFACSIEGHTEAGMRGMLEVR